MRRFASIAGIVGVLAGVVTVASCSMDFVIPPGGKLRLSVYRNSKMVGSRVLASDDPARRLADQWLAINREGWHYGFRTRAPQLVFSGKQFSINVLDDEVTVKFCRSFFQCHLWIKKDRDLQRTLIATATPDFRIALSPRRP